MKVLITRFGGCGDMAPLTVVGQQLKKRGHEVTFALRDDGPNMRISDMFYQSPAFDHILDLRQYGPWQTRSVQTPLGWASVESTYKDYDLVLDYMYCIEGNSRSPYNDPNPLQSWQHSRNSNWTNWVDLHLAWANIDPTSVSDEEKRPIYVLTPEEKKSFEKMRAEYKQIITIQSAASSRSRTWDQGKRLPKLFLEKYPDSLVLLWSNEKAGFELYAKNKTGLLKAPEGASPLRFSMAVVGASDVFIGADTGFTHVAEGLDIPHVAIYSTVPAWTRNKYYRHQVSIDPGAKNPDFYTFSLALGDPLRIKEGEAQLTEREKKIEDLYLKKTPGEAAAEELDISQEGLSQELRSLMTKRDSWQYRQSVALASVTAEEVFKAASKLLN